MDDQINEFLKSLRAEKPTGADMNKWQAAVQKELQGHKRATPRSRWIELVAAAFVGAIIGAAVFHGKPSSSPSQDNLADNATYELVVTKTE